ncbi:MAG: hypothetical protein FWD34_02710 [Oscillospiraceae bacterium]|nr:hypothetical protein [Oscillospiraceae bacterium]
MKSRIRIAVMLAAVFLLTGCTLTVPAEDLISPPKLTDEQSEIYRALTNSKGMGITLKYPKAGEYRSAFVFREEKPSQGVVFYESSGLVGEPAVWLAFLEKRNGRWECTYELSFFAMDIEKVEFSTLGDSDRENIIISYSVLSAAEKGVSVVAFSDEGVPEEVYRLDNCLYYEINDFNKENHNSLFIIRQDRAARLSEAYVAAWSEDKFVTLGRTELNPDAVEYLKIIPGFVREEVPALFIEYLRADNSCNTSVISWVGSRLNNSVYTENEQLREENLILLDKRPNSNTTHAYSRDVTGDGIIEVGGNADFPGYDLAVSMQERVRAVIWYNINSSDRLIRLCYSYLSVNNDYIFIFPDEWVGSVTVTVSHDGNEVIFWEYNPDFESVHDVTTQLFSITTLKDTVIEVFNDSLSVDELYERLIIF